MTRNCQVSELLWIPRAGVLTKNPCKITLLLNTYIKEQCHHLLHHIRITLNQHIILQLNLIYRQTAVVRELVGNTDVTSDLRVAIGQQSSGNPRLADAKNQPTNQAQLCN